MSDTPAVVTDPRLTDDQETSEEGSAPRRWLIPVLVGALVVMFSLAVTFFVLWLSTADPEAGDVEKFLLEQEPAIEEVSSEVANLLFTYDSTTLDTVADRMLGLSTGNFAVEYEKLIFERGLADILEKAKASSRGTILEGPDVSFRGPNEAQAIFNIRQTVQNSDTPGGVSFIYVTKITLVNTEGEGWKADRIDVLSIDEV
ncbi:MAG TPA: hypothetical protein VEV82_05460 [Actinomycetota bacterium]|nr:hypothetical protein [Actinomycetota bacterium]